MCGFGKEKTVNPSGLNIDPFIRVISKGEREASFEMVIDSRITCDVARRVSVVKITETNPVFAIDDLSGEDDGLYASLSVRDGASDTARNLAAIKIPANFVSNKNLLMGELRNVFLDRIAESIASQNQNFQLAAPTERLIIQEKNRGRRPVLSWLVGVTALIILIYGLTGLLPKKDPDPFANLGLDPQVRAQIEAAGLHGAANPTSVNVTEQTLRAMGLDPGKAANMGCLAN